MRYPHNRYHLILIALFLLTTLAAACGGTPPQPTFTNSGATPKPTTATPFQPITTTPTTPATHTPVPTLTPTPEPLAAQVNGQGISLADYQAELGRYQAAQKAAGKALPSAGDQQKIVLDSLVDTMLLAQAASEGGYHLSTDDLKNRLDALAAQMGGVDSLAKWAQQNGYTDESFRRSLAISASAAWERDQVTGKVPLTADQVHARQILVYNKVEADANLAKLQSGVDFATLALAYDRDTGGDLGWFPQGYLLIPEVEAAAFGLKPGQYSDVIQSKVGFHLVQVLERDPQHPLSPDARLFLQKQALAAWVADRRSHSNIVVMLP